MSADLIKYAELAVDAARKAGASDAWGTSSQGRDVEFEYRDGKLEKVKDATSRSLSIKLYVDGRYSTHSINDLREKQIKTFIAEAVAITRALQPDEYRRITPPELFQGQSKKDLQLVDQQLQHLDREQRLAWCRELDALTHTDERLISATCGVYDGTATSASVSSNGFSGTRESTYLWMGTQLTFKDQGDKRASSHFYAGGTRRADLPSEKQIADLALKRVRDRLGASKGPTTQTTMVVDPSVAGSLISRLLKPAKARAFQQGQSFWADYQGSKPFSEKLTIVDDPLLVRGMKSRRYDSEGIAARPLTLVENGVVKNIYVDTYYGRKLKMQPTTGSSSNVIIKPGASSLSELISAAGEGIYVTSWLGGNADNTTGEFSLGLRGHLIRNGKIGAPVDEMNVTGDLETLFASLAEVGNDPWLYSTTRSPTLVFENVHFSGA